MEARIRRSKTYWGRVDGVIGVRFADGSVHTVVVEAKSLRTRNALHGHQGCGLMLLGTLVVWAITGVPLGWILVPRIGHILAFVAAAGISLLAALFFLRWAADAPAFVEHRVLREQLFRYPAGERWLAVTADYVKRHPESMEALVVACGNCGVGLVSVSRRGECLVHREPGITRPRDLFEHYEAEEALRISFDRAASRMPFHLRGR